MIIAIVPAFNEEKRIAPVLKQLKKHVDKMIVVDDGSSDKTSKVSKKHAIVVRHIINLGKGAALRTGCKKALEFNPDHIIFIDSDGQHDPEDIKKFKKKLEKGFEVVQGVRKMKKMPFVKRIGNSMINMIFYALFGLKVRDTQSGFKAFKTEVYPKIKWESNGYFVETEMLINVGKNDLRYGEVEIKTIYKDKYKGITMRDGLRIGIKTLIAKVFG